MKRADLVEGAEDMQEQEAPCHTNQKLKDKDKQ